MRTVNILILIYYVVIWLHCGKVKEEYEPPCMAAYNITNRKIYMPMYH